MTFSTLSAEKYLNEVGYTSNFIYLLKNQTPSTLPLPKIINIIHKKDFLAKQQDIEVGDDESVVVAVALFIFDFILELKDLKNAFSLGQARIVPIFVLPSLYAKRKQAILDLLQKLKPFVVSKSRQSVGFASINSRKFSNFHSIGTLQLRASDSAEVFYKTVFAIPALGKKFSTQYQVFFHPESGTSIRVSLDKKNLVLNLEYRMDFVQQFSFDGVKNPKKWIESNIVTGAN